MSKRLKPGTGCYGHTHYEGCGCNAHRCCCGCPPPAWIEETDGNQATPVVSAAAMGALRNTTDSQIAPPEDEQTDQAHTPTHHDLRVQRFIRDQGWCGAFTMGGSHVCILPRGHKPAEHCGGAAQNSSSHSDPLSPPEDP